MDPTKPHNKECAICLSTHRLSFHHLIPKTCHKNKWFKKQFDKSDMQTRGIDLCRPCHSFLHKSFSEKMLGRELNTLDKIRAHPTIQKYEKWAKKRVAGQPRPNT